MMTAQPFKSADKPHWPDVTVLLGDPNLPDHSKPDSRFTPEDLDNVERLRAALTELSDYRFDYWNEHGSLLQRLTQEKPDFVMNFCDTGYRNVARHELHIAALLEMLEIPYSGSGPVALGLCYDKSLVRSLAAEHGVAVPYQVYWHNTNDELPENIVYPAFIKPNSADGSVGISRQSLVHNARETRAYLAHLREELPGQQILIQEFLGGAEYSIGLIGNPGLGFNVLPLLTVDYSQLDPQLPKILDYGSKVDPQSPYWKDVQYRAATPDATTRQTLANYAGILFERLGLRDYGRFDFRCDSQGMVKLLEVNPNPAWCWDGKLNLMSSFQGLSYSDLLGLILQAAQQRHAQDEAAGQSQAL